MADHNWQDLWPMEVRRQHHADGRRRRQHQGGGARQLEAHDRSLQIMYFFRELRLIRRNYSTH